MFNPRAKHRQEKFVKFFTISAALMNWIRRCAESNSVLLTADDIRLARSGQRRRKNRVNSTVVGGCWMLDVGCSRLDVRGWMLDVRGSMLDVRGWMLDVRGSMLF